MGLGIHLIIDGFSDKSLAERAVLAWLETMPGAIGMTPITEPFIHRVTGGWSGYRLIAESHISLHCVGKAVHCDVFSCKDFVVADAINLTVQMLGLEPMNAFFRTIDRGWLVPVEDG